MQSPRFNLGTPVRRDESRHIEFKEVKGKNPVRAIVNAADEYAVAFLNSEGGRVLWGVRDTDGVVVGVALSPSERDLLRRDVTNKLCSIQPQIDPTQFRLELHALGSPGSTEDLFVVELISPRIDASEPFYTGSHDVFVHLDGVKMRLSGPQLTAWIKQRVGAQLKGASDVSHPAAALVSRIQQLLAAHGLEVSHLPRFFSAMKAPFEFSLADAQSAGAWLSWLNEERISWISNTFGVRREWIDGEDDRIYWEPHFDKNPKLFWDTVCRYAPAGSVSDRAGMPEAYFIRCGKGNEWTKRGQSGVFVVLAVPLLQLSSERTIWRYISDFNEYPWDYGRTQIQLRAWARLLYCGKSFVIHGREMSLDTAQKVASNTVFLRELIEDRRVISSLDWHVDDYALSAVESAVAKAEETLPEVFGFLQTHGLPVFSFPRKEE